MRRSGHNTCRQRSLRTRVSTWMHTFLSHDSKLDTACEQCAHIQVIVLHCFERCCMVQNLAAAPGNVDGMQHSCSEITHHNTKSLVSLFY